MVENTKFILYGQGEIGQVYMVEKGDSSREIPRGSFFGTAVLTQLERGEGYTEHVSANSGCILLLVSRDQLQAMELIFPTLKEEFLALEQRLQGNKLATTQSVVSVHDPDSPFVLAWETWVFAVMTLQWALVMLQACYPMESKHKVADALMIFLELSFRKYLRSGTLMLDILALIPFFIVNLAVPSDKRWDLLNVNKLLRLFKVPKQFRALETKYLKHTTELRLFKLLYYTFMLSHFLGCIWFNFASRAAVSSFASVEARTPAFGANHWLPSEQLEHGSHVLQYMASLYWSFGLMSASSEPEFPKSTAHSETREFSAKMRSVQKMLDHFQMPEELQQRVKTFLLFKRYHSITQEGLLVRCLPPSLLTDIRLVHLRPMIEKVEFLRGMEGSITRMLNLAATCSLSSLDERNIFGENGLFTNGKRNACVQAQTCCILYRLSRESMELVFARYPKWKQKQRRGMATITGMMLSRADIMNERAEQLKEKLDHARLKRSDSEQLSLISITLTGFVKRYIQNPFMDIINGIIHGVPVQTKFHIAWLRLMVFCTIGFYFGYLVSWHIQESPTSLELYEQNLRSVYKKQRMFCDVIAAIPFCGVLFINRRSVANELTHFLHVWMMYLLVIHWVACSYLAVATEELEISDPENPSSSQLSKRFLRGLFFATTAFVKNARNMNPETAVLYTYQITRRPHHHVVPLSGVSVSV
ncbi:uncharacterized protein PITG_11827 [Phytophthora infestans T30-4]|uniref:Cyclic nucleotide-binding domain-containing protein n=1 Tax=Phytophthora infestans (strain T30-4) TaxID=403677 RepID=D0NHX0_PHYIT|nr:uncharacterized protein PITG_11827 [Phytophthora infestans T30-4]EEY58845.1 conserved hypothetical protein [Phytophthora infestans T30-4]|eukprot:XP_002901318.1 conserved hypothetical protein [Phytophthora infestans T30-4]